VGSGDDPLEGRPPLALRAREEVLALEVQHVEEERGEGEVRQEPLHVELPPEPAHRHLERLRRPVGPERDRLAVEHERRRRRRPRERHHLRDGGRHLPERSREDPDPVAVPVHLHPRAVELPLEGGLAERREGLRRIRRALGEHRRDRLADPEPEPREPRRALAERGHRDRREGAGEHRGAPDLGGGERRCPRDRLDEHALERALAELAQDEPGEEVPLLRARAGEERAEATPPLGAARPEDRGEDPVHLRDLERRRPGRRRRRRVGAADRGWPEPDPALGQVPREPGGHDRPLFRGEVGEEVGERPHLLEPSAGARDGP
jgi:hypothetical protein